MAQHCVSIEPGQYFMIIKYCKDCGLNRNSVKPAQWKCAYIQFISLLLVTCGYWNLSLATSCLDVFVYDSMCLYVYICVCHFRWELRWKGICQRLSRARCAQTQAMDIQLSAERTELKKGGCTGIIESSGGSCSLGLIWLINWFKCYTSIRNNLLGIVHLLFDEYLGSWETYLPNICMGTYHQKLSSSIHDLRIARSS